MFRGGRAKKKKGNFVRALRTSIGWIIPSQNTKVERKDEKKLEQQKDDSRKAYAEELKRKIKRSRGLGNRLSSIFSGRKASTIHPADILSIQRKKESKLAGHGNGSEAPLERRAGGGNGRIQLQEVKSPSRRMSASRLLGLGQEYIYKDFMPYYIERYNRWETFDSLLKRANKWIKENQLQVLTLETMIVRPFIFKEVAVESFYQSQGGLIFFSLILLPKDPSRKYARARKPGCRQVCHS
jgi:hypothetical protein